ncbi:MAG: hypothetical protein IPM97_08080 [Bdellovibrionaceae bacterium]|nr:hypothetical protein [Pseudobdellovibrionaceae bacterium]
MKKLNFLVCLGLFAISNPSFAGSCDIMKSARQVIKAIVAIEDMKGITAYYGGLKSEDSMFTTVNVQPYYQKTKDWYLVKIRNNDCRILSAELIAENIPQ